MGAAWKRHGHGMLCVNRPYLCKEWAERLSGSNVSHFAATFHFVPEYSVRHNVKDVTLCLLGFTGTSLMQIV